MQLRPVTRAFGQDHELVMRFAWSSFNAGNSSSVRDRPGDWRINQVHVAHSAHSAHQLTFAHSSPTPNARWSIPVARPGVCSRSTRQDEFPIFVLVCCIGGSEPNSKGSKARQKPLLDAPSAIDGFCQLIAASVTLPAPEEEDVSGSHTQQPEPVGGRTMHALRVLFDELDQVKLPLCIRQVCMMHPDVCRHALLSHCLHCIVCGRNCRC